MRTAVWRIAPFLAFAVLLAGCFDRRDGPVESDPDAETGTLEPELMPLVSDSLESPVRMALTRSGRLLVSDARQRMIFRVDPVSLRPDQGLQVDGEPSAVGLMGKRIFVGNVTRRTIEVYASQGGSLRRSFGRDAVEYPMDLAVDEILGLVFVVDGGAKEIKVFDVRGRLRGTLSGPGLGIDRLQAPTAIAVDETAQEVFVSDYGDPTGRAAVKVFDYDGNFLSEISGAGSCGSLGCSGGFSRPQGIALDDQGRVYVADALLAEVLVFERATGNRVQTLGGRSVGPPFLRIPLDLAIDQAGDLFVTSNRTASIELYRGVGASP